MSSLGQVWGEHWAQQAPSGRLAGLTLAVAIHVAAVVFLVAFATERGPMRAPVPIAVRLMTDPPNPASPPTPVPAPPRTAAVKPAAPAKRVPQPPPVQKLPTTAETAEAQTAAAPPAMAESATPDSMPNAPIAATTSPPAAAGPPSPAPVNPPYTPPGFSADYLSNPAPAYPLTSRRFGEEGAVTLGVFVSEQGLPERVELRKSSGFARLDEAALAAVRRWKFVPAHLGNTPVAGWVLVPISFSLRS